MNQWYRVFLLGGGGAFGEGSVKECALCAHFEIGITAAASAEDQIFLDRLLGHWEASLQNQIYLSSPFVDGERNCNELDGQRM